MIFGRQNLRDYVKTPQWPIGATLCALAIALTGHWLMGRRQVVESYAVVALITVVTGSMGLYEALAHSGLSAAFWGILAGISLRACRLELGKDVLSGEFFVKIGGR